MRHRANAGPWNVFEQESFGFATLAQLRPLPLADNLTVHVTWLLHNLITRTISIVLPGHRCIIPINLDQRRLMLEMAAPDRCQALPPPTQTERHCSHATELSSCSRMRPALPCQYRRIIVLAVAHSVRNLESRRMQPMSLLVRFIRFKEMVSASQWEGKDTESDP